MNKIKKLDPLDPFRKAARSYIKVEDGKIRLMKPVPERIVLYWDGKYYLGILQKVGKSPKVVLLYKKQYPVHELMIEAILEIQPNRTKITADDSLNLIKEKYILRRTDDRLTELTPAQKRYREKNPPEISEAKK